MQQNSNSSTSQEQNHVRVTNSLLGNLEKKSLLWMSARMPAWVSPDTLTAIGMFAAFLIFLGYTLTIYNKAFLWLASFGFLLNWFGDSMDGTLARYRKIERPRYGFFVDHIIDSISVVLIFVGIGLSPYVRFDLALLTLVTYLLLSIFVYLGTFVNGVFRISYAGLGPTETRMVAILANTFVFFTDNPFIHIGAYRMTFYDLVSAALCVLGGLIFVISATRMAIELSREDRVAAKNARAARRQKRREDYARRKTLEHSNRVTKIKEVD